MINQFDVSYWCVVVCMEVIFQNMSVIIGMVCEMWVQFVKQFCYDFVIMSMGECQMMISNVISFGKSNQWFNYVVQFFCFRQSCFDDFMMNQ